MSAIDDIKEELEALEIVRALSEMELRRRETLRKAGYAEYHRWGNKWRRLWRRMKGKYVMSEATWKEIVDLQIDTLPRLKGE